MSIRGGAHNSELINHFSGQTTSNKDCWAAVNNEMSQYEEQGGSQTGMHSQSVAEMKREIAALESGSGTNSVSGDPRIVEMETPEAMQQRLQHENDERAVKVAAAYAQALEAKEQGTAEFKAKTYGEALRLWGGGLRALDTFRGDLMKKEVSALRDALHTNRAMAQLQLKNFAAAEADCDDVLYTNPGNAKAMFRRAQARVGLVNWAGAASDLENLLIAKPNDAKATALLERVRTQCPAGSAAAPLDPKEAARVRKAAEEQQKQALRVFMAAQQELGRLTVHELQAALRDMATVEGSGVNASDAAASYHNTLLSTLSEALMKNCRDGAAEEAADRAIEIVLEALRRRLTSTLALTAAAEEAAATAEAAHAAAGKAPDEDDEGDDAVAEEQAAEATVGGELQPGHIQDITDEAGGTESHNHNAKDPGGWLKPKGDTAWLQVWISLSAAHARSTIVGKSQACMVFIRLHGVAAGVRG